MNINDEKKNRHINLHGIDVSKKLYKMLYELDKRIRKNQYNDLFDVLQNCIHRPSLLEKFNYPEDKYCIKSGKLLYIMSFLIPIQMHKLKLSISMCSQGSFSGIRRNTSIVDMFAITRKNTHVTELTNVKNRLDKNLIFQKILDKTKSYILQQNLRGFIESKDMINIIHCYW